MIKQEYFEHYTHFLLSHGEKIRRYVSDEVCEYYEEVKIIIDIFDTGVDVYTNSKYFKEYGVGLADAVEQDYFYEDAIKRYEFSKYVELQNKNTQ